MSERTDREPAVSAVFGLPEYLPRADARSMCEALETLWRACHGQAPGALRLDLELHRRFFDPVAQGKRLRATLLTITPNVPAHGLSPTQTIAVDEDRTLITPEGRVALELLTRAIEAAGATVRLDTAFAERW